MKTLFVYPDINIDPNYGGYDYLGISYLSAALKREGFETGLLHLKKPVSDEEFLCMLRHRSPDLVAFTSTTNMLVYVKQWAKVVKKLGASMTILGGIHASLEPEESIGLEGIDMICIGEGEGPILDVARRIAKKDIGLTDIPNMWFKNGGNIERNAPRPLLQDLDTLPFPDMDIYKCADMETYRIFASRGCPYACSYCFNRPYRAIFRNSPSYVRFRSPKNIIEELAYALKKYKKLRSVHFVDDILPLNRAIFAGLVKLYKKEIGLPCVIQVRPNLVDEETVRLLKELNCYQLQIGIESGNDHIRNDILKRNISLEQIKNAFVLAKKYGLKTYSYNMVGIPHENKESIMDTLRLNAELDIDLYHTSFFYPYPGTELEAVCRSEGLMGKTWNIDYFSDTILKFNMTLKGFVIFVRHFFTVLVPLYKKIYKLPAPLRRVVLPLSDFIITSPVFYITVNFLRSSYIMARNGARNSIRNSYEHHKG